MNPFINVISNYQNPVIVAYACKSVVYLNIFVHDIYKLHIKNRRNFFESYNFLCIKYYFCFSLCTQIIQ